VKKLIVLAILAMAAGCTVQTTVVDQPLHRSFAHWGNQILFEPNGAVVEIKEKYGSTMLDTVTLIEIKDGNFVLYGMYDEIRGWYPVQNHSITIKRKDLQCVK
jgi:hypothetical protein